DVIPSGFPEANPLFGMTVSATEFEWQMKYLKRHYNLITFQQFADWFYGGAPLPPYPALITFDDGHSNNFEFALPILSRLAISASFFVVSGSLGRQERTWFEDAYYRLMFSADQLCAMREKGFEIGAHTVSHPILSTLEISELQSEISESKAHIESILGGSLRALAYPFGAPELDFGQREMDASRQEGFIFAF